jgi:hypothetical protein
MQPAFTHCVIHCISAAKSSLKLPQLITGTDDEQQKTNLVQW